MSELVKMLRETALIKIAKMDRRLKEKLIKEEKEKDWTALVSAFSRAIELRKNWII